MAEGEQAAVLSDSVQDFASSAVRMLETLWNRIEASLFNWHALVELAIIFAIAVAAIETGNGSHRNCAVRSEPPRCPAG